MLRRGEAAPESPKDHWDLAASEVHAAAVEMERARRCDLIDVHNDLWLEFSESEGHDDSRSLGEGGTIQVHAKNGQLEHQHKHAHKRNRMDTKLPASGGPADRTKFQASVWRACHHFAEVRRNGLSGQGDEGHEVRAIMRTRRNKK